jgi:hypothetical protein
MTVTINLTVSPSAIVTGIGACLVEALEQTPAGVPCRQCLLIPSATIPWDGCDCDCDVPGQVAQAITSVYSAETFPAQFAGSWRQCGPHFTVVNVTASVIRCVPVLSEQGVPPSCLDELAAAVTLENDRTAVRQALACCLAELATGMPATVRAWSIGPSTTVGESGGCAGVETTYQFSLPTFCPCPG